MSGIRTLKSVDGITTKYILNGGNVIGEVSEGTTTTYLRGINLICTDEYYYVFDAHGDVVNLTDANGNTVKTYDYDAFGVEKDPDEDDTNPFRYCGEYWDSEIETYYLRARYYDPNLGRFTSEDTHWNVSNMIYGDNPQKINEREDMLGLTTYSYAPSISSIVQSGNLYVFCLNNPVMCIDPSGHKIVFDANATEDQISQYNRAIEYLRKSSTAAALIEKLEEAEELFTIEFIDNDEMGFSFKTLTIFFDPQSGLIMSDKEAIQSAALGLAHEMGHAAQYLDNEITGDVLAIENANLKKYETPIAIELGEPTRNDYFDVYGTKRMNNSTHYRNWYRHPWHSYILPWRRRFITQAIIKDYNER